MLAMEFIRAVKSHGTYYLCSSGLWLKSISPGDTFRITRCKNAVKYVLDGPGIRVNDDTEQGNSALFFFFQRKLQRKTRRG